TVASLSTILSSTRRISFLIDEHLAARRKLSSATKAAASVESAEDVIGSLERQSAELERMRMELSRAACLFADALCHPLTRIFSLGGLLGSVPGVGTKPIGNEMARNVLDGARQMHKLVEDYLSFFNAERHAITTRAVSMESLVHLVRHELEPEAANRKVTWKI